MSSEVIILAEHCQKVFDGRLRLSWHWIKKGFPFKRRQEAHEYFVGCFNDHPSLGSGKVAQSFDYKLADQAPFTGFFNRRMRTAVTTVPIAIAHI